MKNPNTSDPTGNSEKPKAEMPIASLRQFLIPDAVVLVKLFSAADMSSLEKVINDWVGSTFNLVAMPGPVTVMPDGRLSMAVTYVESCNGNGG